jgi:hypothetical protein
MEYQDDPLPDSLEVSEVNCSNLRASEAACKSDKQQSPISEVLEPIAQRLENDKEVLTEKRCRLTLCRPCSRRTPRIVARNKGELTGLGRPWAL